MKTTFRSILVSLLLIGTTSLVNAQSPAVTHNTWSSGTPLPTPVAFATSAVLKNEIYVVGGTESTGIVSDVQVYNLVAKTWSAGVSYPTGISAASAAVVKNVLYVFGGTSDGVNPTNAVWEYSPKTKTWTGKAEMPTARWATAAVVEKNIIMSSVVSSMAAGMASSRPSKATIPLRIPGSRSLRCWKPRGSRQPVCREA